MAIKARKIFEQYNSSDISREFEDTMARIYEQAKNNLCITLTYKSEDMAKCIKRKLQEQGFNVYTNHKNEQLVIEWD